MRVTASNRWLLASLASPSKLGHPQNMRIGLTDHDLRAKKYENPKHREKEDALRKVFTEQVRSEETRFRQWEQQVRRKRYFLEVN